MEDQDVTRELLTIAFLIDFVERRSSPMDRDDLHFKIREPLQAFFDVTLNLLLQHSLEDDKVAEDENMSRVDTFGQSSETSTSLSDLAGLKDLIRTNVWACCPICKFKRKVTDGVMQSYRCDCGNIRFQWKKPSW